MALFDDLLKARDAIGVWLANNQTPTPDRQRVVDAATELSQALETIIDEGQQDAVNQLGTDAAALNENATRLQNVVGTINAVQTIVNGVGAVVPILLKVVT